MHNSHIIFQRDIATDNMIRVSIKHELVLQIKAYFSSSILQRVIAADNTMGELEAWIGLANKGLFFLFTQNVVYSFFAKHNDKNMFN